MGKKQNSLFSDNAKRVVMLILGSVCSTLVLIFSVLTIITISNGDYTNAPNYLLWVFISMGLSGFVTFLKSKTKINFIRAIVLFAFCVILGIIVMFAKENIYLFSLTAGSYCLLIIISRIFLIIEKRSLRTLILNIILIVLVGLLSVGLFIPVEEHNIGTVVLIECLFIAFTALAEVAVVAFSQLKFRVLFKIVINTFALEILFGLLATMVAGALALFMVEEAFTTFADALWYCFAVVTTIGFGDFVAVTPIGRIISVILGMYGIVAVAVITSIIVNFYNETSGKKDAEELKQIKKDEEKKNR